MEASCSAPRPREHDRILDATLSARQQMTGCASLTVAPAPWAVGLASRHARRWSSDRKKLIVVQSESKALQPSSPRLPNQTIRPSAFDPTPSGVAAKCSDSPQ